MNKSNLITLSVLCVIIMAVIAFTYLHGFGKENDGFITDTSVTEEETSTKAETSENVTTPDTAVTEETAASAPHEQSTPPQTEAQPSAEPAAVDDALFIGDSRTVGIMEYAGLNGADYFCSTGMNVFSVRSDRVSVPSVGKVTLSELLECKKYGKIYIMLGVNELGFGFQSIIDKYGELIEFVENSQKDADIFIQANLHVSRKRSESDGYINNSSINRLNSEISKFANGNNIFYIDANGLFDDEAGNLSADKTADDAHLLAKYYAEWGKWICTETANLLRSGDID